MKAKYQKYILNFKQPSGTSRGILTTKETFILEVFDNEKKGIGECAVFRGLSYDDLPNYEEKLQWLCLNIHRDFEDLKRELLQYPSIIIGLEQALLNLKNDEGIYFPSPFTEGKEGVLINGLIWMGNEDFMLRQIQEKLSQGFHCIKLKIGVDWETEKKILQNLRKEFPKEVLELRVDANGAFDFPFVQGVLEDLAKLEIHSIEQPIKAKNWKQMSQLSRNTPIPIALDEDLIGLIHSQQKIELLDEVKPQFIILKPSLCGGFSGSDEWIALAEERNVGWWITSALESNIGLNAIAQYTYTKQNLMPQGLGTGALFTNNFESHLELSGDLISFKL
ncbi:MAG: o-succinylbenzoate synthase [Flavobacteriaceae bacterium]|nr:o-succinylbenzoate synthase [Flavobacteriaceae bacterium]